jgi:hypothetical protein
MNGKINKNLVPITWIDVEVTKGMFSTEKAVFINLSDGQRVSLFADDSILRRDGSMWKLKVTEIGRNRNKLKILLPSEAYETSSRWAEVSI